LTPTRRCVFTAWPESFTKDTVVTGSSRLGRLSWSLHVVVSVPSAVSDRSTLPPAELSATSSSVPKPSP
jgi:hypothetical protein